MILNLMMNTVVQGDKFFVTRHSPARPPTARLVEAPKGRPCLSTWEKRGKQGPQNYFYIITQLDWDFHNFSFLKTNKKQINKTRLHRKNLVFNTHNVSIDQIERIGRVCNLINKQIPAFDELIWSTWPSHQTIFISVFNFT